MKTPLFILLLAILSSCHHLWLSVSDVKGKKHKVAYSAAHDDKEEKLDEAAFRYQYSKEEYEKFIKDANDRFRTCCLK